MEHNVIRKDKKIAEVKTAYLEETPILNYKEPSIQSLIMERAWMDLEEVERVKSIYSFVRDEIKFGYNRSDDIVATKVLQDGYGQCNTKATLLMALLRACHIPNRIHGFTIDKALQKGAIKGVWYKLAPKNILHSWVEVQLMDEWYFLEGVILDKPYLKALQNEFRNCGASFCGYGAYTEDFLNPRIDFELNNTFIQEKGINQDFGVFNNPDAFYSKHQQNLPFTKRMIYENLVRFLMNKNVDRIRRKGDKR
ncbi:MAG: transglutaminase-like domain-containing protein [Bacteroidota bacterium]